ncbi:MAG: ROK family protein [Actinomycetota bacterium]|nr:ROK family protein [Actinomycetota bacterium]
MTVRSAAIGVDIGGTGTKAGLVDLSGRLVDRVDLPTDPQAATKSTIQIVEHMVTRAEQLGFVPVAVGIGAAGFVDVRSGVVTFSPNLTYDDPELADAVAARVQLPVMVDNDVNAAVWGERAVGAARGTNNVALIMLGTGVGSGFIVNGRVLRGHSGAGAELGHTIIEPGGEQCGCGLKGCLEQYTSGPAIARMAKEALRDDPESSIAAFAGSVDAVTSLHVARAARELDETARAVMRRAGRALGIGLSNVANLFDPEIIVLSGSVIKAGEPLLGPARDELARMTTLQRRRPLRLAVTSLGAEAGIIGAAALAIDEMSPGGADRDPRKET